jgi:hypothetical protein
MPDDNFFNWTRKTDKCVVNVNKNYKLVLEAHEYVCLPISGIYWILVKFQKNLLRVS